MFKVDSGRKVFFNGKLVSESEARISIYDSALMFGDMVFEMTRSFNKKQFKLEEHISRLFIGLKILEIEIPYSKTDLLNICDEVMSANDPIFEADDEHRLMINISRGPLGIYSHLFDKDYKSTVIVADFPLRWTVSNMAKYYEKGIDSVIPSQRAIPSRYMDPKIKNRSRMWYQMANIEVSKYKGDDNWALLIDDDGFLTEGTGDNFFMVSKGVIYTPEGRNILKGIMREYIFELAKEMNIEIYEKNIEPYDVYCADEAFITGTPFCILPTTSLNGKKIGDGKMGKITKLLLSKWSENVGLDIMDQMKKYYKVNKNNEDKLTSSPYQFRKKNT